MNVLTFWVPGPPVPKGRARTVRVGGKVMSFTPKRTRDWESAVRLVAQSACASQRWKPTKATYSVAITVNRARRAGDVDNFAKGCLDAMNTVVWPDDVSVMHLEVSIVDGKEPGVLVRVTRGLP